MPVTVLPEGTRKKGLTLSYLAAGGMSVAYRGVRGDGSPFFVKEVRCSESESVMALTQEKALLERLKHPGIPKVHDLFEHDGYMYLIADFIEGGNLEAQLSPFPDICLSPSQVVDWGLQLCHILEYLHAQDPPIIYRDLKPKNVIRHPSGKLYLVDFGIARAFKAGKEQDTRLLGSVLTASPEHYGGQTDVRSDLYTLGATLHYLLSNGRGERLSPFDFPALRSLNPQIPADLEMAISRCLRKKPEERFQNVVEFRQVLEGRSLSPLSSLSRPQIKIPWGPLLGLGIGVGATLLLTRSPELPKSVPSGSASPRLATLQTSAPPVEVTAKPVPLALPTASASRTPLPPPRPTARPEVAPPRPTPRLAAPEYPLAQPSASSMSQSGKAQLLLRALGRPDEDVMSLRGGSLSGAQSISGPGGLFSIQVPRGFRVVGEAQDFALYSMGRGTRVVRVRTVMGESIPVDELVKLRKSELGDNFLETRSLQLGSASREALVYRFARRLDRVEEVFWTRTHPPATISIVAASSSENFPTWQSQFETWLGEFNPGG